MTTTPRRAEPPRQPPRRPQHRRRAAATILAAILSLTLLTSCTNGPTTSPAATDSNGATINDSLGIPMTRIEVTLAEQATIARTLVDDLVALAPADDWRGVGDGPDACDIGLAERSPKMWIYRRRSFTIKDPAGQLDRLAATLTAKGWTVTTRDPRSRRDRTQPPEGRLLRFHRRFRGHRRPTRPRHHREHPLRRTRRHHRPTPTHLTRLRSGALLEVRTACGRRAPRGRPMSLGRYFPQEPQ